VPFASAYALKGDIERAAAELAEARRLNNDFFRSVARVRARYFEVPKMRAHLFGGPAQGRNAAGMTDTVGSLPPRCRMKLAPSCSK
jgi:hypothetical protein